MTESRTRIDDAIDRAVRGMLRRDPPAGFRRRVLSRLERASARSKAEAPVRRTFVWRGLAAAGAVIAILAIVNVVVRDVPRPVSAPPDVAARVPGGPPAPAPVSAPEPGSDAPAADASPRRPLLREPVRTATFGPRDGRISAASIRAATPIAATTAIITESTNVPVSPVAGAPPPGLSPLEIPPIVIPPIQIAPVQVAPLSPPR
jgi:hypothetical protein